MEIKNYLHLYLGCDCKAKWFNLKFESHQKLTAQDLVRVEKDVITSIKPILRPLSSMTEEEFKECLYDFWLDEMSVESFEDQYKRVKSWPIQEVGIAPKTFHYLLSKHFDLFGLIEKGLAIDATKLNAVTEP